MNTRRCLRLARHIDKLLRRELGSPVDPERMVADSLYARDVLLVCDAMRDDDLAQLALRFRRAALAEPDRPAGEPSSGFSASRFLSSLFGGLGGGPGGADKLPPTGHTARPPAALK